MSNIIERFIFTAERFPTTVAIIDEDKSITYEELLLEVKQCAFQIQSKGLKKGDSMILFIPMGIELYRTVLACFYLGIVAVFVDEWVNLKRLELCCEIANCKGFSGSFKANFLRLISRQIRRIPVNFKYKKSEFVLEKSKEVESDDTALITFTTGSTGTPKAANRTHGFLHEQLSILVEEIKPQPNEISMPLLPIVLLINLSCGATSVIAPFKANKPKKLNAQKILLEIQKNKVKTFISSPFVLLKMAEELNKNNIEIDYFPTKLYTGGAPVFPNEAKLLNKAFYPNETLIFYGSTESEPISSISTFELEKTPNEQMEKGLPVGNIHPKTNTLILDKNCKKHHFDSNKEFLEKSVDSTIIGEIIVSGPHVLKKYINNPEAEKLNKINVEGTIWHRTGDSGFIDSNGKLYLTGRLQQIIQIGDNFIYPFIEEYKLRQIKGVVLGTILNIENNLNIVLELEKNAEKMKIMEQLKSEYYYSNIVFHFQEIDRDPRHFSKIDYGKIESKLTKR